MAIRAAEIPAQSGRLHVVKTYSVADVAREYVEDPVGGHYKRTREGLLLKNKRYNIPIQQKILAFLRDVEMVHLQRVEHYLMKITLLFHLEHLVGI